MSVIYQASNEAVLYKNMAPLSLRVSAHDFAHGGVASVMLTIRASHCSSMVHLSPADALILAGNLHDAAKTAQAVEAKS